MEQLLLFDIAGSSLFDPQGESQSMSAAPTSNPPEKPVVPAPVVAQGRGTVPINKRPRRPIDREFEEYLRGMGWPYVAVDETKKAIFADAAIASFHYLAYSESGPNLLILVRRRATMRKPDIDLLGEWEDVFGNDFMGCIVWPEDGSDNWRALTTLDHKAGRKPRQARRIEALL